jgi:AcrR family transcriptional regulator
VSADPSAIDGRSARALRTRQAIVEALIELVEAGELKPAAPRIAQRAGVSLRSIYQHFEDLEALFSAAHKAYTDRLLEMIVEIPIDLPLTERLDAFVDQRASILEAVSPARRASLLQEPFSEHLRAGRDRIFEVAKAELVRLFRAEIDAFPAADRLDVIAAADMVASWSAWDALRTAGLDTAAATRVMRRALAAVLNGKEAE